MKKVIFICCMLASCKKIDYAPAPAPMPQSAISGKLGVWPNPSSGKVTLLINVEPTVKYNLSIQSLNGNIIKSFSINSVNSFIERKEDLSSLENGFYDLILVDIKGNEIRTPLIIKH